VHEYHFDGLRFDAVHAIRDDSKRSILVEIAETVRLLLANAGFSKRSVNSVRAALFLYLRGAVLEAEVGQIPADVAPAAFKDGLDLLLKGARTQLDEVRSGGSYLSQNDLRLHFGLGRATEADRIEIAWPSGATQILEHIEADRVVAIQEAAR